MHHVTWAEQALDYAPCRYGRSRLLYRGPKRALKEPFIAFLGGSETYGKFVQTPFVALVEDQLGRSCVNLGSHNSGLDAILQDDSLLTICENAAITVVQAMSAANISNRYYAVHPRRNDRFIQASPALEKLFPDIDFTQFSFTRHLLAALQDASPLKYALVVRDLQATWQSRMRRVADHLGGRVVVLHLHNAVSVPQGVEKEPFLVTRKLSDGLSNHVQAIIHARVSPDARQDGVQGMHFLPHERPAAECLPGALAHAEIAAQVAAVLKQ